MNQECLLAFGVHARSVICPSDFSALAGPQMCRRCNGRTKDPQSCSQFCASGASLGTERLLQRMASAAKQITKWIDLQRLAFRMSRGCFEVCQGWREG